MCAAGRPSALITPGACEAFLSKWIRWLWNKRGVTEVYTLTQMPAVCSSIKLKLEDREKVHHHMPVVPWVCFLGAGFWKSMTKWHWTVPDSLSCSLQSSIIPPLRRTSKPQEDKLSHRPPSSPCDVRWEGGAKTMLSIYSICFIICTFVWLLSISLYYF